MKGSEQNQDLPQLVREFLGPLVFQLDRCGVAYRNYMNDGKTFLHAQVLKLCNQDVVALLRDKSYLLPQENFKEALKLLEHLDMWTAQWECLKGENNPKAQDEFIFQTKIAFPKEAVGTLKALYAKWANIR